MRKRTNALRRRYQRTLNKEELRENRKKQYTEAKTKYQAAIRKEKKLTQGNNTVPQHFRATYGMRRTNLPQGKTRNTGTLTTLQKPDGSKTANMTETLKFMLEQLIPEDNAQDYTDRHKNVRRLRE